jgi:carbamoyl-phosphate synthase small subunit
MQQLVVEEKIPLTHESGFSFYPLRDAYLILQNGMHFKGKAPAWQQECARGELVFNTGLTGYDASLTDPSYSGEILLFTYPIIGNYGIPDQQLWESDKVQAAGVVVCNLCEQWSHGKSSQSLAEWLYAYKVPLIMGIDTRQLTRILRDSGTMPAVISPHPDASLLSSSSRTRSSPASRNVSINQKISYAGRGFKKGKKVILVDCGMKQNILRTLQQFPLLIERVPYNYDYSQEAYDGVFLSNGPGDPEEYSETIQVLKKALANEKPVFGICLGAQLLALAAGAKTYKLRYGHRSHNQPCIDLETQRCYITSQNHGYAIDEESLPPNWKVNFKNLNDGTVEGVRHASLPFYAVQFHPEAAPGPTDTQWLFEHFFAML